MCGADHWALRLTCPGCGLPPRVRGGHQVHLLSSGWWRTTPACAGRTQRDAGIPAPGGDYPRVCGADPNWFRKPSFIDGLPPRVRADILQQADHAQLIGLPPRVRGGLMALPMCWTPGGLPPRVRGGPVLPANHVRDHRTTPACAGRTRRSHELVPLRTDYPRVCGADPR